VQWSYRVVSAPVIRQWRRVEFHEIDKMRISVISVKKERFVMGKVELDQAAAAAPFGALNVVPGAGSW
jgi:hypothetical protein